MFFGVEDRRENLTHKYKMAKWWEWINKMKKKKKNKSTLSNFLLRALKLDIITLQIETR